MREGTGEGDEGRYRGRYREGDEGRDWEEGGGRVESFQNCSSTAEQRRA